MSKIQARFGGHDSDAGFVFEFTGGTPSLDFVNTLDDRLDVPKERLTSWERFSDWAGQAGILDAREREAPVPRPASPQAFMRRVLKLRELLFRLFEQAGAGQKPFDADWIAFLRWLKLSSKRRTLEWQGGSAAWSWGAPAADADTLLLRLVEDAARLLADPDRLRRLRICGGSGCAWLFLDNSRRRDRRWCDMSVCGNRAKARSHYQRIRQGPAHPSPVEKQS